MSAHSGGTPSSDVRSKLPRWFVVRAGCTSGLEDLPCHQLGAGVAERLNHGGSLRGVESFGMPCAEQELGSSGQR